MSNNLPGGDTQPWYRQFWLWFLITLPACVVVAAFYTLYIANRHADDLVVDEYYKDGLAINRQLEKLQLAQDMGITASLRFEGASVIVETSGPVGDSGLSLFLSHPLEADRDFRVELTAIAPGFFTARLQDDIEPRWHWRLEAQAPPAWRLDGVVKRRDFEAGE
jgi:hypothetical protein